MEGIYMQVDDKKASGSRSRARAPVTDRKNQLPIGSKVVEPVFRVGEQVPDHDEAGPTTTSRNSR
jgi:hypothetical protein